MPGSSAYTSKRKYDQKVKKNNKIMIIPDRVQPIGHWEDGHMTNF